MGHRFLLNVLNNGWIGVKQPKIISKPRLEFQFNINEQIKKAKPIIWNKEAKNIRSGDEHKKRWGIMRTDKKFRQLKTKNKSNKV